MDIIDIHTHLGDILTAGGDSLIDKGIVEKKLTYDVLDTFEEGLWESMPLLFRNRVAWRFIPNMIIQAGIARNQTATLANMQAAMAEHNIAYCGVMAVYPHVRFTHLQAAAEKDSRILPFTGADFDSFDHIHSQFASDVRLGARGLKLHPILQQVSLTDARTFEAVEAFAPYRLPVLFHAGYAEYFRLGGDPSRETPAFGNVADAVGLIQAFPHVNFIVGHAGLDSYRETIELLAPFPNALIDTSFHKPAELKELIDAFTVDRVLYGSDWPWGGMAAPMKVIERVTGSDHQAKEQIFFKNSAALLNIA